MGRKGPQGSESLLAGRIRPGWVWEPHEALAGAGLLVDDSGATIEAPRNGITGPNPREEAPWRRRPPP